MSDRDSFDKCAECGTHVYKREECYKCGAEIHAEDV